MTRPQPPRRRTRRITATAALSVAIAATIAAAVLTPTVVVQDLSTAISPYAAIVGFLGGLAAIAIYLRKLILAVGRTAQDAADQSTAAARSAEGANSRALAAGAAAEAAGRHAKTATDTAADTNKAIEWLLGELVAKDEQLARSLIAREYLKTTVDTAVAQIAYQAADNTPPPRPKPRLTTAETALITGRHRFHPPEQENA